MRESVIRRQVGVHIARLEFVGEVVRAGVVVLAGAGERAVAVEVELGAIPVADLVQRPLLLPRAAADRGAAPRAFLGMAIV
jgi:hypothetical protein